MKKKMLNMSMIYLKYQKKSKMELMEMCLFNASVVIKTENKIEIPAHHRESF